MMGMIVDKPFGRNDTALAFKIMAIIIVLLMAFRFYSDVSETVTGWFGKSRADLIAENKSLKDDVQQAVQANEEVNTALTMTKELGESSIKGITKLKDKQVEIQKKVDKKNQQFIEKVKEIEQDPVKTEEQKSQEYAEIVIDDLWKSHCELVKCTNT